MRRIDAGYYCRRLDVTLTLVTKAILYVFVLFKSVLGRRCSATQESLTGVAACFYAATLKCSFVCF